MTSLAATSAPRARPRGPRIGRALKPLVFVIMLAPAVWLAFALLTDRLQGDVVKIIEIDTGTLALRALAYTLAITPLRQVTGWAWLATYRRMLGLFVFFYATIHMMIYFGLDLELECRSARSLTVRSFQSLISRQVPDNVEFQRLRSEI